MNFILKDGNRKARPIFRPRRFWPSVLWLVFLAVGSVFSCAFGLFAFFTAVLVAAFIGLNEFGRWSYKTNLVICAGTAVVVAVAGVFRWTEVISLFALFFAVSAWLLYFRDRAARLIPELEGFSKSLSAARSRKAVIENAWERLQEMAPASAVFILLATDGGALYLPEHFGFSDTPLKRGGGVPWKVFGSGRAINVPHVLTARDQPLDMDARSILSVPLVSHGRKIGVLQLEGGTSGCFTEEDTAKLSLAAMILGHELYVFRSDAGTAGAQDTLHSENGETTDEKDVSKDKCE